MSCLLILNHKSEMFSEQLFLKRQSNLRKKIKEMEKKFFLISQFLSGASHSTRTTGGFWQSIRYFGSGCLISVGKGIKQFYSYVSEI